MNARAAVVAEPDGDGGTRLAALRSEAPLVLRPTPAGVYLAGGAAGPLGGDRLALDVAVGPGAALTIRSAAAAVVLPGPSSLRPSILEIDATVAPGASLRWLPEPVVAARGCRHRILVRVRVATGGAVVWRDELVLGRHDEEGGSVVSRMSLDVGGRPVLRHALAAGDEFPSWSSAAVGAGARSVGSLVVVDPSWASSPPPAAAAGACAVLPLAGPAAQVTAMADDFLALRTLLDTAAVRLGVDLP